MLADGPWTEARLRVSDARVIQARHWIEFVRLLKDGATLDVTTPAEEIDDASRSLVAKTSSQQLALNRNRINRARKRLRDATEQRASLRQALLLDDEEPLNGIP